MSGVHTEIVTAAHEYTRDDVPWDMAEHVSTYGRLMHYLSGGGMRVFGRTIAQQRASCRQRRFLAVAMVFAALWLLFYFV